MAVMKLMAAILFVCTLIGAANPAHADINSIEAKEVARTNNCAAKKVDVYQQSLGTEGTTVYKVECTMPKTADADTAPKGADSLLVSCKASMCELLRPVISESK
jgi:cytochrome c5